MDRKADIKVKNKSGRTALHFAIESGSSANLQTLLRHKDIKKVLDAGDDRKNTPLHFAADNKNAALIMLLLQAGANPIATNISNETPLDLVSGNGSIVSLFNQFMTKVQLLQTLSIRFF